MQIHRNTYKLRNYWVSETLFFWFLEYRMRDRVQKPSNSECYTPPSEPFRIYL
jgi:hypothetical protein